MSTRCTEADVQVSRPRWKNAIETLDRLWSILAVNVLICTKSLALIACYTAYVGGFTNVSGQLIGPISLTPEDEADRLSRNVRKQLYTYAICHHRKMKALTTTLR
jgi:hypothetical protein